jgi:site-specific DNA-methyltransferase (cytosine-N4-specific)
MEFLTDPGDLVCDPFAGSNTTGEAAESLGRRWVSCDLDQENGLANSYVRASAFRFPEARLEAAFDYVPSGTHTSEAEWAEGLKSKVNKRKLRVAAAAP